MIKSPDVQNILTTPNISMVNSSTEFTERKEHLSQNALNDVDGDSQESWRASFLSSNKLLWVVFLWLGISALLPWSCFITSAGYFRNRFCGSAVETNFLSIFSFTYNVSNTVAQALLLRFYHRMLPLLRMQVLGSLVCILVVCLINTVCVFLPAIPAMPLFFLSVVSISLCGALVAMFNGGLFAVVGQFPGEFTQAVMSGSGLAGAVVSMVSFITIIAGKEDEAFCNDDEDDEEDCSAEVDYSALAFFVTCCMVVAVAIVCYLVLEKLPATKEFQEVARRDRVNSITRSEKSSGASTLLKEGLVLSDQPEESARGEPPTDSGGSRYWRVYQQIKVTAWSVFLTFAMSLSLFPTITVLIIPRHQCDDNASRISNDLFIPLVFFVYTMCDFLGRISARHIKSWVTPGNMLLATLLRVVYYPLIMLCNVEDSVLPVVFRSDVVAVVIIASFGLTNGLLGSLAMSTGPSLVAPRHKSLAATIMLLALTLGLCVGSSLSFVSLYISQGIL